MTLKAIGMIFTCASCLREFAVETALPSVSTTITEYGRTPYSVIRVTEFKTNLCYDCIKEKFPLVKL